jgi:hypothetical protein
MSILMDPPNSRRHGLSSGVVKRFEKQIKNDSVPLLEKFVTWINLLSFVDESEELLLEDEKNDELKGIHRSLTETSIVLGEWLLKQDGLSQSLTQINCKIESVQAKIRMLRYKDRMWHGDLDSAKSEQVIESLFGALS